jgi:hypothetical protein
MAMKDILLSEPVVYGRYDDRFGQETGGLGSSRCHVVSLDSTGDGSCPVIWGENWLRRCAATVAIF